MANVRRFCEVREFQRPAGNGVPKVVRLVVQSYRLSFRVRRFEGESTLPKRQSRFGSKHTALGWMNRRSQELIGSGFHQVPTDSHAVGVDAAAGSPTSLLS